MHACGHDGHTAIGITLAEMLAARRRERAGHRGLPVPARRGDLLRRQADDRGRACSTTRGSSRGLRPAPDDADAGGAGERASRSRDGFGRLLRRRDHRARRPRRVPAPVDRSHHRRRQHPARHAEPGLARDRGAGDGRAHRGTDRRRGPSTTSFRRPPSCAARSAPSIPTCALRSRSAWARTPRGIARAYRAEASLTLSWATDARRSSTTSARSALVRDVRGGRAGRRRGEGRDAR